MQSKAEMMEELRKMLQDVFALRHAGAAYSRLARAHGYVDGYMRALLESGQATRNEILALVAEERTAASGPATRTITHGESSADVAA
jgi:hypothetical protein